MKRTSHTRKPVVYLAACLLLGCSLGAYAAIYKTVDKDGNVVFTDVPPADDSQAIELKPHNNYSETRPTTEAVASGRDTDEDDEEAQIEVRYDQVNITTPTHDAAVRANDGNLQVAFRTSPDLDISLGHTAQLVMDGQVQGKSTGTPIPLTNVDRGTHQLILEIVDANGATLATSDGITFHMLRAFQAPKRPAP